MILHPGILALLLGSLLAFGLLGLAGLLGLELARHWQPLCADEAQLCREQRADLVATLVRFALGFQIFTLPLFIFVADSLHPLFVGAMCATGVLNAAPGGWSLLWIKLVMLFGAGLWLVVNHYDQVLEHAPWARLKFLWLLPLLLLSGLDLWLLVRFFSALQPEIITSCCGALFSSDSGSAAAVVGVPLLPAVWAFFTLAVSQLLLSLVCLRLAGLYWRVLLALNSLLLIAAGLIGTIAFVSIYTYELPLHHCPFDLLQRSYQYRGYPLYASLFACSFWGLGPLLLGLLNRHGVLAELVESAEQAWLRRGLVFLVLLVVQMAWPLVFSPLRL